MEAIEQKLVTPAPLTMSATEHNPLLRDFSLLSGRIGLLGGSFDPLHVAHLEMARQAMQQHNLDAIVLIPAKQNPLKANSPVASDSQRLDMLTLALAEEKGLYVSPVEFERQGVSYTIDTLRKVLASAKPDSKLFLIVGADCLPEFHRWKEYERILSLVTVIPIGRPASEGQPVEFTPESPAIVRASMANLVQMNMDISSRSIRAAVKQGQMPTEKLSPAVAAYIQRHGLYR